MTNVRILWIGEYEKQSLESDFAWFDKLSKDVCLQATWLKILKNQH